MKTKQEEIRNGAARRGHCYALHNATDNPKETAALLVVCSFVYGKMKYHIDRGDYNKVALKDGAPLAWIVQAMEYCTRRLGSDIVRKHLDGGGVRVARAW